MNSERVVVRLNENFFLHSTRGEEEEKKANKNEKTMFSECDDVVGVRKIKQFQEKLLRRFFFFLLRKLKPQPTFPLYVFPPPPQIIKQ